MRTGQGGMSAGGLIGALAAALLALAAPAQAGDWQYDPASDLVYYGSVPVARWYGERPSMKTGLRHYRGHLQPPPCPHRLCGYPLPIYKARERVVPAYRVRVSAHAEWCAARYRSYDVRTDTYQPYHGPRRRCWSPYR